MKSKHLMMLGGLVVAAAAALVIKPSSGTGDQGKVGKTLFTTAQATSITEVAIADKDGIVTKLGKGTDGAWSTAGDTQFPVDGNRLGQFFDAITDMKISRRVGKDKAALATIGLEKPSRVVTLRNKDKVELEMKFGDQRPGGGIYIAFGDSEESYLLDRDLPIQSGVDYWELKTLTNIDSKGLKSVEFRPDTTAGKLAVTLSREAADQKFVVQGLGQGEQANEPTVAAIESLLTQFQFTQKYPITDGADKEAMGHASTVVAQGFNESRYTIKVGKSGAAGSEKWFAQISVLGKDGKPSNEAKDQTLNAMASKWAFEISSYQASKFDKSRADFIGAPAKPDAG